MYVNALLHNYLIELTTEGTVLACHNLDLYG